MSKIELPRGDKDPVWSVWDMRPEQGEASVALIQANWRHSALPTREREAARVRTAQLNGCLVCKSWRVEGFGDVGADDTFYDGIENWRNEGQYSKREQLAMETAERFSTDWTNFDDKFMAVLRDNFADSEIVDLLICIGQYVAHGRLVNILDLENACAIAPAQTAASRPVNAST